MVLAPDAGCLQVNHRLSTMSLFVRSLRLMLGVCRHLRWQGCPLEELVLQIHLLGLGPAAEFLARVIEPPPAKSITGAVSQLQAIGALTPEEAFTPLGASRLSTVHVLRARARDTHPRLICMWRLQVPDIM